MNNLQYCSRGIEFHYYLLFIEPCAVAEHSAEALAKQVCFMRNWLSHRLVIFQPLLLLENRKPLPSPVSL
jgi:hypothetical protein